MNPYQKAQRENTDLFGTEPDIHSLTRTTYASYETVWSNLRRTLGKTNDSNRFTYYSAFSYQSIPNTSTFDMLMIVVGIILLQQIAEKYTTGIFVCQCGNESIWENGHSRFRCSDLDLFLYIYYFCYCYFYYYYYYYYYYYHHYYYYYYYHCYYYYYYHYYYYYLFIYLFIYSF